MKHVKYLILPKSTQKTHPRLKPKSQRSASHSTLDPISISANLPTLHAQLAMYQTATLFASADAKTSLELR